MGHDLKVRSLAELGAFLAYQHVHGAQKLERAGKGGRFASPSMLEKAVGDVVDSLGCAPDQLAPFLRQALERTHHGIERRKGRTDVVSHLPGHLS